MGNGGSEEWWKDWSWGSRVGPGHLAALTSVAISVHLGERAQVRLLAAALTMLSVERDVLSLTTSAVTIN